MHKHNWHFLVRNDLLLSLSRDVLIFIVSEHMRAKASVKERNKSETFLVKRTINDFYHGVMHLSLVLAIENLRGHFRQRSRNRNLLDADDRAGRMVPFIGIIIF